MGPFERIFEEMERCEPRLGPRRSLLLAVHESLSPAERIVYENAAKHWLRFEPRLKDAQYSDKVLWSVAGGVEVARSFKELAFHVLRTRKPPASVRNLSTVAKAFTSLRRQPKDVRLFFARNRDGMRLLLESKDWELADVGITVDGITVSDTTGRADMSSIVKLIQSSATKIRASRLPRVTDILYGQIFVAANLSTAGSLAFYRGSDDTMWIREKTRQGTASEHSVIHEFGHRYWGRFLSKGIPEWKQWDKGLRLKAKYQSFHPTSGSYPKVGERLPVEVQGYGSDPPIVMHIDGDKFYVADNKFITRRQIQNYYIERRAESCFPTKYSLDSGDPEEHFCEAFAMYILGDLEEPHYSKFKEIFA